MSDTLQQAGKAYKLAATAYQENDLPASIKHLRACVNILRDRVEQLERDPIPDHVQMRLAGLQRQVDHVQQLGYDLMADAQAIFLPTPGDIVMIHAVEREQAAIIMALRDETTAYVQFWHEDDLWGKDVPLACLSLIERRELPPRIPLPESQNYRTAWLDLQSGTYWSNNSPYTITARQAQVISPIIAGTIITCLEGEDRRLYAYPSED